MLDRADIVADLESVSGDCQSISMAMQKFFEGRLVAVSSFR
jgi:hypothetical protein